MILNSGNSEISLHNFCLLFFSYKKNYENSRKILEFFKYWITKQQKTMFATGVTMGLAERIIDDTCLDFFVFVGQQIATNGC